MERINVGEAFRVCKSNCNFKMEFNAKVDMRRAYEAMAAVVNEISDGADYSKLWLQDLADGCGDDSFSIEYSTLSCTEFNEYIPAMCKAVAEAIPDASFEAYAYYDDLRCYWVDEFEVTYKDHQLTIIESSQDDDCGYFCPECGYSVGTDGMIFDGDEIICDDCEEHIMISNLKYVPPTVIKSEFFITE